MANALQELILRIGGDSSGGQQATRDLANALSNALVKALKDTTDQSKNAAQATDQTADAMAHASAATSVWVSLLHNVGQSWVARIAEGILLRDAIEGIIGKVKEMIHYLPDLVMEGSKVAGIEKNFDRLTEAAGLTASTLTGTLRAATHNTVTDFELMKRVNQDLAAGMNLTEQQFGTLAKGAYALAKVSSTDVQSAFDTMNDAMLTGRTRSLALLTGKIDATAAEEAYAKKLGGTKDQLTEEMKIEAVREAILKSVGSAIERVGEQTDGLGTVVKQVNVWWANFQEDLGKTIAASPVLKAEVLGIRDALVQAFGGHQEELAKHLTVAIENVAIASIDTAIALVQIGAKASSSFYDARQAFGDFQVAIEGTDLALLKLKRLVGGPGVLGELDKQIKDAQKSFDDAKWDVSTRRGTHEVDIQNGSDGDAVASRMTANLEKIKQAMIAAQHSTKDFVGPLEAEAAAHEHAGDGAAKHAGQLKLSKEQLAEAKKAQEEYNKAVERYNSTDGADYASILNKIGNEMFEGIAFDHARGKSTADLILLYGTTSTVIEQVIKAQEAYAESVKATEKSIAESEATGLEGAAAVSKGLLGPQSILHDWLISMGAVPISLHSILTPMQELGHVMTDVTVGAKEHFDDLRDTITGDYTNIIATMKEHGVQTREDLQRTADEFKREYDAMLASGKFTTAELAAGWYRYRDALTAAQPETVLTIQSVAALAAGANTVNSAFAPLASLSPTFATLHTAINGVATGIGGVARAYADMASNGFTVSNLSNLAAGWVGIGITVFNIVQGWLAEQDAADKAGRRLFDASTAARRFGSEIALSVDLTDRIAANAERIGIALNAISPSKLAAINAQLDEIRAGRVIPAFGQIVDAGRTTPGGGASASGGYTPHDPTSESDARTAHLGAAQRIADALAVMDVLNDLGGLNRLTAAQLDDVRIHTRDLLVAIQVGGVIGAEAFKTLDNVMGQFAQQAIDSGGVVDQFFTDMVEQARAAGIVLPQVTEFFKTMAANAATGLSDLLRQPLIVNVSAIGKAVDDARDALDKLKASGTASANDIAKAQRTLTDALKAQHGEAVRSKQALDDLGQDTLTAFNIAIASGQDFVTALQSIAPQLATIQQAYKDLGLEIDDTTLKGLTLENTILNGTADAPSGLGKAISGLNALITAAMNLGRSVETPAAAAAQQRTLGSLYSQAQANSANAGVTGDAGTAAALEPFQRTLHQLQEWASKNNVDLDENTKQMIDQSQQLGIWNDDFKTDSEKTRDSLAKVVESADHLADVFGGVASALANGLPPGTIVGATGGLVTAHGVVSYLAGGGLAGWPWMPQGTDTVPAMLTPGERVLTVEQQRRIEEQMYQAARVNSMMATLTQQASSSPAFLSSAQVFGAEAAAQVTKYYNVAVAAKDPAGEEQWLRDWMRRDGVEITVEEVEDGRFVSRLRRKLGSEVFT